MGVEIYIERLAMAQELHGLPFCCESGDSRIRLADGMRREWLLIIRGEPGTNYELQETINYCPFCGEYLDQIWSMAGKARG